MIDPYCSIMRVLLVRSMEEYVDAEASRRIEIRDWVYEDGGSFEWLSWAMDMELDELRIMVVSKMNRMDDGEILLSYGKKPRRNTTRAKTGQISPSLPFLQRKIQVL